jgi:FKBP-type peptidyl-prolyl cis-trans isomerase 2
VAGDLLILQFARLQDAFFTNLWERRDYHMPSIRHILVSAIGVALLLAEGSFMNPVQAVPTHVNDATVQDGAEVTVRFQIAPWDDPTLTYIDTEKFIQGKHLIPPGIEQRVAGMRPGESITFPLSVAEAFGPYPSDETKIATIPPDDLPFDARKGDTVEDRAARLARILKILPEMTLLDLNHPLAGKPLIVTLQIMTIENPD